MAWIQVALPAPPPSVSVTKERLLEVANAIWKKDHELALRLTERASAIKDGASIGMTIQLAQRLGITTNDH